LIETKRYLVEELQMQQIADPAEREEVRKFYNQYRNRFSDVDAARYALRGVRAEFDAKNPKPETKPKAAAPARPAPEVATGARDGAPPAKSDGPRKMPLSEYNAKVRVGGPAAEKLRDQKDNGEFVLDYSR
jgi:hypothetical protein